MQNRVFEREERATNCSIVSVFASPVLLRNSFWKPASACVCVCRCVCNTAAASEIMERVVARVSWDETLEKLKCKDFFKGLRYIFPSGNLIKMGSNLPNPAYCFVMDNKVCFISESESQAPYCAFIPMHRLLLMKLRLNNYKIHQIILVMSFHIPTFLYSWFLQ